MATPLDSNLARLRERASRGMVFGTERTREALSRLGGPEAKTPAVHVAGTNGKGSVVAFVESVARTAGLRTGAFTSPPLGPLAETIRIDGASIPDDAFAEALGAALDTGPELSLFETLTVAAFVAFSRANVDLALVEAGLGGRLDATNVIPRPLATAVVHVALEHTAELGDSLASIARHKAGIARPGVPMILGPLPEEARIAARAEALSSGAAPLLEVRPGPSSTGIFGFSCEGDELLLTAPPELGRDSSRLPLGLAGPHQVANGAVAAAVVRAISMAFPGLEGALSAGLRAARWPGRFEVLFVRERRVILDGAHNPSGARALADALRALGTVPEETTLVLGIAEGKDVEGMGAALRSVASRRVLTAPRGRRGVSPERLAEVLGGAVEAEPVAAFERALADSFAGETLVVTGSLYAVGPVRAWLVAQGAWDGFVLGGRP